MEERIDLVSVEEEQKRQGISLSATFSLVLHVILLIWFIRSYKPSTPAKENVPISRYVELMQQNPQDFVEAPGPKLDRAPRMNAPLSDASRKASMPQPTGETPTTRPGDGRGEYRPRMTPPGQPSSPQPPATQGRPEGGATPEQAAPDNPLIYREPTQASVAPRGKVDWNNAIRDVTKVASLGSGDGGFDMGNVGGERGSAEQGPLSFETSWYDWGPYAQSMISKIRVNWYAIMPQIIRTGMQGNVVIRFTIQRDGRITDVTILKSSGIPPYDMAAKRAIENSSPLNPLPKDFPNPSERVIASFYYNMQIPGR